MYKNIPLAEPDPIFHLNASYQQDSHPQKVNLGIGAYRTDEGKPWVLPSVKKAEMLIVNNPALDHEYLPIEGLAAFTEASAAFALGASHPVLKEKRYAAVQAISGTGAVRLGAAFLARFLSGATAYISNPTWANHRNILSDAGFPVKEYRYWNPATNSLDVEGMLADIRAAPNGSVFLLHSCAHNPTGVDPTPDQWAQIADCLVQGGHYTFFDSAYQGFASGHLDRDAMAIRYFATRGIDFLLAQSYSKNFGLYNERCGCLVAVTQSSQQAIHVRSQLAKLQRAMVSNPPAFGARIVSTILTQPELFDEWLSNLKTMAGRIQDMRQQLYQALLRRRTPGKWSHIVDQIGMFSFTGLNAAQVKCLKERFHIYLTDNGRISMAGLNSKNVEYFADAVDYAVRQFPAKI